VLQGHARGFANQRAIDRSPPASGSGSGIRSSLDKEIAARAHVLGNTISSRRFSAQANSPTISKAIRADPIALGISASDNVNRGPGSNIYQSKCIKLAAQFQSFAATRPDCVNPGLDCRLFGAQHPSQRFQAGSILLEIFHHAGNSSLRLNGRAACNFCVRRLPTGTRFGWCDIAAHSTLQVKAARFITVDYDPATADYKA
jgi:hypothetical protein